MTIAERRITLVDGIARVEDVTLIAEAPATGLLPAFSTHLPTTMPVLPEGTAAWHYNPKTKHGTIIVSRKPQVVDLLVRLQEEDAEWNTPEDEDWDVWGGPGDEYKKFRVAIPWTHWVWSFTSSATDPSEPGASFSFGIVSLYWSPGRLTNPDSEMMRLPLPNIYSDGHICWGEVSSSGGSFAERIDSRITAYFSTEFNDDLDLNLPEQYAGYSDWAAATERDEYCWNSWPFYPHLTVRSALAHSGSPMRVPEGFETWSPPPERFTVARAREWARTQPADARRRMFTALSLELDPATVSPAIEGSALRFVIQEVNGTPRIVDTTDDRRVATNIRELDLLGERRDAIEAYVQTGRPIPSGGHVGTICACATGARVHNIERSNYEPDFFTTQGHRHEEDL